MDKAEADRHDKMLELSEVLTQLLLKNVPGISENIAEEASIFMAKNRTIFATAFKSNIAALDELVNAN